MATDFLTDGGVCGELVRTFDWASTSLGPIASWPASLRSLVAAMLHTRQPMLLFWGPDQIQFYNDSFVPSFGQGKHPTALGQRARDCWADAWPVVGAQLEAVMSRGEPAWHEDALVPIYRNGRMEEVFWTYSYSPAYNDDGAVYGTLVVVTEMTGRVIAARRLGALSRLSVALSTVDTHEAALSAVLQVALDAPADLPFAIVTKASTVTQRAGIAEAPGAQVVDEVGPDSLEHAPRTVDVHGPAGPVWPEPVRAVVAAKLDPLRSLMFGVSPRLPVDDAYRSFIAQIFEQLASALARIDKINVARDTQRQRDSLLMQAPVATAIMTGPTHMFELANPLYCRIVGRNPVGKAYVDAFPELRDTPFPALLDSVYEKGEPVSLSEAKIPLDVDGSGKIQDCFFNFNLEPLRDEHGRVYGMMAVAVDISAQVRANRAKDDFLAMLGHELRNPLAPIVTALELLKTKQATSGSDGEHAVIERQVRHVVRLVDDLLDVSKITRGLLTLEQHVVDLADVVRVAAESCASVIAQRGHRLSVEAARGATVDGDEARLVQVIANLLTNAARYTPSGGDIRVSLSVTATEAVIAVTDTGAGIAPELAPRIFDAFVQGTRSPDRAEGGLGLGLAIVKNLVSLHGGRVSVHSDGIGRGSTFTVALPLVHAHVAAAHHVESESAEPGAKRVLVVDDNADAADLLAELVRSRGHSVTVAHDPHQALALIGEVQPEFALLDLGLPGMDGYELAEQVLARFPSCRVIALTGYGQDSDRNRTATAGFAAHLVKPVKFKVLMDLLASA